jgi:fused signal recognition particle receptor
LFGLLKNKIKGFTDKLFGKTKSKVESSDSTISETVISDEVVDIKEDIDPVVEKKELNSVKKIISKEKTLVIEPEIKTKTKTKVSEAVSKTKIIDTNKTKDSVLEDKDVVVNNKDVILEKPILKDLTKDEVVVKKDSFESIDTKPVKSEEYKSLNLEKKEKIKKNVITSLKGIFSSKIKLNEIEIASFLEEFEFSLLEADVSLDSASNIVKDLRINLVSSSFDKNNLLDSIKKQIKISLKNQLNIDCDINTYINNTKIENEPYIILFIGPNGVGKTTTIAKLGSKYKAQNKKIIFSSSDTFRAGSIQQLEKHANNLDIRVIKQDYGSDPAAVAYDAVSAARASNTDYVFIDTAGRQETNHNLMEELKKIKRVVKPNLTIYVAESQAGQAVVEQIKTFDEQIGVDGAILTKIDTDPKGGVAISILNELKKPIFFIGTGQEYDDLIVFSAEFIIDRIV